MTVYVDVLLFINTILNYAVLMTAEKLIKADIRLWRMILSSFTGAMFSLSIFIPYNHPLIPFGVRILSSLTLTLIAFGFHGRKAFSRALILTLSVSLFYCGFMILFYQLFKPPNMLIVNDTVYLQVNPILLVILTAVIYCIILLLERLFRERIKATVVSLQFTVDGKEYACVGKIDTGCNVIEPFSSSPVVIADSAVFQIGNDEASRVIPYSTLGGSSYLRGVKAERVIIDKTPVNKSVYIASAPIDGSFQAIINSDIVR